MNEKEIKAFNAKQGRDRRNAKKLKEKLAPRQTICGKCGSPVKKGYCIDEACPFSDSVRKREWLEHCKNINAKPKIKKPASQKSYINDGGCYCPVCNSANVYGGNIQIDDGIAWQEIGCGECSASWRDFYKLAGYENLQMVTKPENVIKVEN